MLLSVSAANNLLCLYLHLQIVDKIFKLIDQENLGTITSEQIMDFLATLTNTR